MKNNQNKISRTMKNILANYFSILLSKSHYFVTLSRLIIKYSDNDCNEDMSKNGEKKY